MHWSHHAWMNTVSTSKKMAPWNVASKRSWSSPPASKRRCKSSTTSKTNTRSTTVSYTDEAIRACVTLTSRYITDRHLPDKAIDALDEVGSRVHLTNINVPEEIVKIEEEIEHVKDEKNPRGSLSALRRGRASARPRAHPEREAREGQARVGRRFEEPPSLSPRTTSVMSWP